MEAATTGLICGVMFGFLLSFTSADKNLITAKSGQNVTLTYQRKNIRGVEWSRAKEEEYVLLYRDELFVPDNQHPSFKNRVDLRDRQMKDGDVSLILKNVTSNDAGTYECRVFVKVKTNSSTGADLEKMLIYNITLRVVPPPGQTGGYTEDGGKEDGGKEDGGKEDGGKEAGRKEDGGKEDGSVGLKVGVPVGVIAAVVVGVFLIYKKLEPQRRGSYQPPVEQQPV